MGAIRSSLCGYLWSRSADWTGVGGAIWISSRIAAVYFGGRIAESSFAESLTLSRNTVTILMAAYGFIASVLPVWMLLCPRDYLSSYLKIGTIAFLIIGVILVHPNLNMPALTPF